MRSEASLAKLIKDHGDKWVIELTGARAAWVAVRRDDLRFAGKSAQATLTIIRNS